MNDLWRDCQFIIITPLDIFYQTKNSQVLMLEFPGYLNNLEKKSVVAPIRRPDGLRWRALAYSKQNLRNC